MGEAVWRSIASGRPVNIGKLLSGPRSAGNRHPLQGAQTA
jgi:hypothetical protein